ncbi:MAG: hypothetical protein P8R42_24660 [Candidatus Binatia bacterium]|nr:hypothetical protein [Candidatus Binatia bacterium]
MEGPVVAYGIIGSVALASVAMLGAAGIGEEGIRLVIRITGRVSMLLFAAAFAASSAFAVSRNATTRWLRRNRRYLGVGFAGSQTIHLLAIVALAATVQEFRDGVGVETLVVGGMAYVFTFAMAATSFDAAVRRLGRGWHRLHLVGSWWIFAVFALTILPDAGTSVVGAVLSAALIGAWALRVAARRGVRAAAVAP